MEQSSGGGVKLPAIMRPLRLRNYRFLAAGTLISLFGDGLFLVALPLQVYEISNVPTAMAVVGAVWTTSQLAMLLVGGWAVDRFERRRIMIAADLVRAAALVFVGVLSITGELDMGHFLLLGAVVGAANAFFNPAAMSIVPDLLPDEELPYANSFLGVARPAMVRLLGPATGGLLVGLAGAGAGFVVDGATFVLSALLLSQIRPQSAARGTDPAAREGGLAAVPTTAPPSGQGPSTAPLAADGPPRRSVGEGLRFVRANTWCWAWLATSAVGLLAFTGPVDMLLPFVVKNELGLSSRQAAFFLGTVLASGGAGSVLMALWVGQRGFPRKALTAMYAAQATAVALLSVYGLMNTLWQGVLAAIALNAMFAFTDIVWTTTLQRRVPRRLLGRVSSLDWMASLGAMPLSFVFAGHMAERFGAREILVGGSMAGALVVLALMAVPGARLDEALPRYIGRMPMKRTADRP